MNPTGVELPPWPSGAGRSGRLPDRERRTMKERRNTTTSNFGVGARENHDSTPFYDRFRALVRGLA